MDDDQIRRFFETQLAASAHAVQRDARRITLDLLIALGVALGLPVLAGAAAISLAVQGDLGLEGPARWIAVAAGALGGVIALLVGFRRLMPAALSANDRVNARFVSEIARPAITQLRRGWTYERASSLTRDELFASNLFHRIPLTRFDAGSRIRGLAHDLPFEMHEVTATGLGERQFMRILLIGFLAHLKLDTPLPGQVRFCRQIGDKSWRRPEMDGYRSLDAIVPTLNGHYHVDATPDGTDLAAVPGLIALMEDLAKRGWLVHVAFGGLSAWVAIERSRLWFEPRVLPPYSADDLLQLDYVFSVVELVAGHLRTAVSC